MVEKIKHSSLIKFNKIELAHNYMDEDGEYANHNVPFFIFPAEKYFRVVLRNYNGIQYAMATLRNFDKLNIDVMFDYLKYDEELRKYQLILKAFDSSTQKFKMYRLKAFYKNLSAFILSLTTDLYYSKCHLFDYAVEVPAGNNQFNVLFGEGSRGYDFSFDEAFGHALELEKVIRNHFRKMFDYEFPEIKFENVVSGKKEKTKKKA